MPTPLIRTAALAAPLIWFLNQVAQFALAPLACAWKSNALLVLISVCALALDAVCGVAAWSASRDTAHLVMPRWLALSGVVLSAGFFLVIFAQALPNLMLAGCV